MDLHICVHGLMGHDVILSRHTTGKEQDMSADLEEEGSCEGRAMRNRGNGCGLRDFKVFRLNEMLFCPVALFLRSLSYDRV